MDPQTLLAALTGIGGNQVDMALGGMLQAKAAESRANAFKVIQDLGVISDEDKNWIKTGK